MEKNQAASEMGKLSWEARKKTIKDPSKFFSELRKKGLKARKKKLSTAS